MSREFLTIVLTVIIEGIHLSFMAFDFYGSDINDAFDLTSLANCSNLSRNSIRAIFSSF